MLIFVCLDRHLPLEKVQVIFTSEWAHTKLSLEQGLGGMISTGLVFDTDDSFFLAVAVACKMSVVCNESDSEYQHL